VLPGFSPISVDRHDPITISDGAAKRMLGETPPVAEKTLRQVRGFVLRWCKQYLRPILKRPDFEEWLLGTSYNEKRKEELRQAMILNHGMPPPKKVRCKVKSFVKLEAYDQYKHARLINSRHDRFKVWCGPFFKAIEEQLYHTNGPIKFIKTVPVEDRPALIAALPKGLGCYSTDFTAYEKHFTAEVMHNIEFVLYRYMMPFLSREELNVLFSTLAGRNEISSRSGFRANVEARRMSGEMCTSLGNGFTNMILASYIADQKGGVVHGFVEGDDGLFVSNIKLTAEDYKKLGFEIKIKEEPDPCSASFCGLVFAESGQIIRDPRKFLMKFGWSHSCIQAGKKVHLELLRAKALSTLSETPHCPIVSAVAMAALDDTVGCNARFVEDGYHLNKPKSVVRPQPAHDTRVLFERLYHISVEDQLLIEDLISKRKLDEAAMLLGAPSLHYETRFVAPRPVSNTVWP